MNVLVLIFDEETHQEAERVVCAGFALRKGAKVWCVPKTGMHGVVHLTLLFEREDDEDAAPHVDFPVLTTKYAELMKGYAPDISSFAQGLENDDPSELLDEVLQQHLNERAELTFRRDGGGMRAEFSHNGCKANVAISSEIAERYFT